MTQLEQEPKREIRLQYELGSRVYTEAEKLRRLALARIGIETSLLQPGVDYEAVFSHPDKKMWRLSIENRFQPQLSKPTSRFVVVEHERGGFEVSRYFQPDGSMMLIDKTADEAWVDSPLAVDVLLEVLDCLDVPASGNCDIAVNFKAFKPHDFSAANPG